MPLPSPGLQFILESESMPPPCHRPRYGIESGTKPSHSSPRCRSHEPRHPRTGRDLHQPCLGQDETRTDYPRGNQPNAVPSLPPKADIADVVQTAFEMGGARVSHSEGYPGWKPNPHSEILEIATASYKRLFGTEAKVKAIHAGLECGLFLDKYPRTGHDILRPHTARRAFARRTDADSFRRIQFWRHLLDILKHVPEKK